VKNQLGKVMNLRAFTIGVSAAVLALACSGSDDNKGNDPNPEGSGTTPVPEASTGPVVDPPSTGPVVTTPPPSNDPPALDAAYVESMLRTTCGGCHGVAAKDNCRAGMCYIEDVDALIANGKITPGDPNASLLYQRISKGEMPPAGNKPLTEEQVSQIATFILKLPTNVAQKVCTDQFISWDQVYTAIQSDLLSEDADDRVFLRYVTLTNRYNAGVCDAQLEQDRWAMNKFINSISQNSSIKPAAEVRDEENSKSIYRIDLRDYDLDVTNGPFDPNGLVGGPFDDGWEAIIANNNYAVEFQGDEAEVVIQDTGTTVPVMFSDAIIDQASSSNLYYELLKQADNRDDQLVLLDVDLAANQEETISVFVGTTKSLVSEQETFLRRDPSDLAGGLYYWERFDLDPDLAGESILADPLGFNQVANGSQALFSLPNGLQGYVIYDAAGIRQEESQILFDRVQNDNTMKGGISCMTCHPNGLINLEDEVHDFALDNEIDVSQAAVDAGGEFEDVIDLYRDNAELKEIVATDVTDYRAALSKTKVPLNGSDPVSDTFVRFDKDVKIADFAGDLHYPLASLNRDIARLDPALSGLDNGKTVDRDDASGLYVNSLCITSVANENRPADQECIDAGIGQ